MLDRELSDLALAGLRVGGKYLVERAAILEVLAPESAVRRCARSGTWSPAVALGDPSGDSWPGAGPRPAPVAEEIGAREYCGADGHRAGASRTARPRACSTVASHSEIRDGRAAFVLADGGAIDRRYRSKKDAPPARGDRDLPVPGGRRSGGVAGRGRSWPPVRPA